MVASTSAVGALSASDSASLNRAHVIFWLTFGAFMVTILVGLGWDRAWHTTHPFETFISPPHIFIYGTSAIGFALALAMVLVADIRRWFGPGLVVPLLSFRVPGALIILVGGFALQAQAGMVFDNFWHTSFGLDETAWSFPHAMLGWSFFLTLLGLVACRLAMRPHRRIAWYAAACMALLVLMFSVGPFLGPLRNNRTLDTVRAIDQIPVLLNQSAFQHTIRIYLSWDLTRENPLFILLSALWMGAALMLIRMLDRRARIWLSVALVFWLVSIAGGLGEARGLDRAFQLSLERNPANWMSEPLMPGAVVLALALAIGIPEAWAFAVAGWAFALLTWLIWREQTWGFFLVFAGGPLAATGAALGERIYRVLDRPTLKSVVWFLVLAGLVTPFATGLVDLVLRKLTPSAYAHMGREWGAGEVPSPRTPLPPITPVPYVCSPQIGSQPRARSGCTSGVRGRARSSVAGS